MALGTRSLAHVERHPPPIVCQFWGLRPGSHNVAGDVRLEKDVRPVRRNHSSRRQARGRGPARPSGVLPYCGRPSLRADLRHGEIADTTRLARGRPERLAHQGRATSGDRIRAAAEALCTRRKTKRGCDMQPLSSRGLADLEGHELALLSAATVFDGGSREAPATLPCSFLFLRTAPRVSQTSVCRSSRT
jgi:hypothetical protein